MKQGLHSGGFNKDSPTHLRSVERSGRICLFPFRPLYTLLYNRLARLVQFQFPALLGFLSCPIRNTKPCIPIEDAQGRSEAAESLQIRADISRTRGVKPGAT